MPPKKAGKEESFLKVCKRIKTVLLTEKDSSLSKDNAASYVQQKTESLKLLCDCIQEGGANREAFLEGMQLLRTSIRLQLEDASLLIVNAACHVVSAILLKCDAGSPEETILNWFVPQLFLLTSHSSTAVSTTATEVLLTMGRKGLINAESLSEVLRRCLSKNKTHRWTSYMVLLTVLLNYPATSKGPLLAHFNGPVCKLITAGLHDPNEDVRRVSKRCFSAFTAFQPDGSLVDTMLSGLDAKTVQSLLEEEDVDAYTLNRVAEQTGGVSLFGNMPTAVPLHQRAKSRVVPRSLYTVAALNDELRQVASQVNRTSKHPVTAKPPSSHFVDPVNVPSSPVLHHTNVSIDSTDLQDYLSFLSSGDWEVRLLALERVLHLFSTGELHFPLPDVLTQEIVKRLLDSHFQILRVSLKLSGLFMKKHLESVTLLLPDYLYALLTNSVHAKHDIQQVACLQLKYLVDHVSPGEMEAALQPAIGSGHTPLIRQRSLEVLQFLFQMQPNFFSDQLAMLRVLKLLVFLARGEKYNSAVWTSLLCAVTSLYVVNQRSFLTSVVHLPSEDQSFVKELLKSAVPQLNSDLNTLVKGRTTTLTNPLEVKVPETTFSRIIASRFARKYEEDYFSSPKAMASPVKCGHGRVPSENIPLKERPAFFRERRNRPIQASAFDSSLSSRACGVARTNADEPWEGEAQATQDVPSARWCLDQLRGAYSAQEKCTQLTCLEQILWDPKKWGEGCESSFVLIIDRLGKESTEPNHNVRELAFVCLRSFASVRAMHKCVGRHLYKIVTLCVAGMDDCFIEVQQAAANALHAVIGTFESTSSYDALIAAFCAVLSDWQSGRDYNDGSKGRCEVILSIGRLFESMNASLENKKEFVSVKQNVLKTLVEVLTPCLSHCAPRVQESAFLVLSIMWFLFDTNVLPLFRTLSASQKTLLSFFYNKHYAKGVSSTFVDLKEELEKLGCA